MKKISIALFLVLVVVGVSIYPIVTNAAWWNPVSWFKKLEPIQNREPFESVVKSEPGIEQYYLPSELTFYINHTANLRKCGSKDCDTIGQYDLNTEFVLPYRNLTELPEWVNIYGSYDDGKTFDGYIHKSLFSLNKTQIPAKKK